MCLSDVHGGQKKVSAPLKPQLQVVVNCLVDARNQ